MSYYGRLRLDVLNRAVDKGPHRVLDVGCGEGVNGEYLKRNGYARRVIGIEYAAAAARQALHRLDGVVCADMNTLDLRAHFGTQEFDYILCLDVLEHLLDPWERLRALADLLAPGGRLVVSLPNVRNWRVLADLLLHGRWQYRDAGIMDRSHLRFFTRRSGIELLQQAGLRIEDCHPNTAGKAALLNRMSFGALGEFAAVQWLLVGSYGHGDD